MNKKRKYRIGLKSSSKNIKIKKRKPYGDSLAIDIIETVFGVYRKLKTKNISISILYESFTLNKLYYIISEKKFTLYTKQIFSKYKNINKHTKELKLSEIYIQKVIAKHCYYVHLNPLNIQLTKGNTI